MVKERKLLVKIFLVFIISTLLASIIEAQEKKDAIQQKSEITISRSPAPSKSNEIREDILQKTQEGLDRSISILNVVATLMGVLVALITIVIVIATALGFFEYRRWREIRQQAAVDANKAKEAADEAKKAAEEARPIVNKLRKEVKEIEIMRETIGKIPISPEPALLSEELKTKLDEYGEKIKFLEAFGIQLKPEDYDSRGVDFYYKGKYELALKAFEKAIEIKPDYAKAWTSKGVTLGKLGRHDEELKAYDKAIEIKPDYAEAWYNKGITLGELGRHDEELKAYDKAIEIKPDYAGAWFNKGVTLGKLSRYDEELKAYDKAIEIKPDCAEVWFNKACVHSMKGDKGNAIKNLSRAIKLDRKYKEDAKRDEDFKNLWDDDDFKRITS